MRRSVLDVHHIHCAGCENRLETVLGHTEGVTSVTASHENQTVEVSFDETVVAEDEIRAAVAEAGFEVRS